MVWLNVQEIKEISNKDREITELNSITEHNLDMPLQGFKKVNKTLLREHVKKANGVLENISMESRTETNNLIKACATLIGGKGRPQDSC